MPIIVQIPGVGNIEFDDDTPEEEIQRQSLAHYQGVTNKLVGSNGAVLDELPPRPAPAPDPTSAGEAFGEMGTTRLLDNLVSGTPKVAGMGLAGAAAAVKAGPQALGAMMWGQPADAAQALGSEYKQQAALQPAAGLMDMPSGQDWMAKADSLRSGKPFAAEKQELQGYHDTLRENHPFASGAGELIMGDGVTLATGRAPFVRARQPAQASERTEAMTAAVQNTFKDAPDHVLDKIGDTFSRTLKDTFEHGPAKIGRGLKRTGVGALEASYLAALHDDDPKTAAMLGAGAQAVGSMSLWLAEKPVKRLLKYVGLSLVVSEMFKAAAPGDQDFFASKDWAVQKATGALALGLTAAMAGAGRLRNKTADRFPVFIDSLTAVPRGAAQGLLNQLFASKEAGNELPAKIVGKYATNPGFFSENQQNALGRAMASGKKDAFTKEIERLMKLEDFRKRIEQL